MLKQGCGGSSGVKFWNSLGLLVRTMINCADNTGSKNLYITSVKGIKGLWNRLPAAGGQHGDGHSLDRQIRTKKKATSSSGNLTTKVISKKRRGVSLF